MSDQNTPIQEIKQEGNTATESHLSGNKIIFCKNTNVSAFMINLHLISYRSKLLHLVALIQPQISKLQVQNFHKLWFQVRFQWFNKWVKVKYRNQTLEKEDIIIRAHHYFRAKKFKIIKILKLLYICKLLIRPSNMKSPRILLSILNFPAKIRRKLRMLTP